LFDLNRRRYVAVTGYRRRVSPWLLTAIDARLAVTGFTNTRLVDALGVRGDTPVVCSTRSPDRSAQD